MEKNLVYKLTENFENSSCKTDDEIEFWFARDLQNLLGYDTWRSFSNAINKAKIACELSEQNTNYHFADVSKTIEMPKNATKEIDDLMLTILLKAKDFATEITIFNAKDKNMNTENQISNEHVTNNKTVRETLIHRGIIPENLPPQEDSKKVERKLKSGEKKSLKNTKITY